MAEDVNSPDKWEANYLSGTDGWDLGGPTPIFTRLVNSNLYPPGKLIVLGAGRGYDARLFASHGFTVTAVDFSPSAVSEMHRLAQPTAPVQILQADIFTLPLDLNSTFDYLLEYTCFCAIDPQRRPAYAQLVTRLLKPGGLCIDLAFPLQNHPGGPPFSVSVPEILNLFSPPVFSLILRETPPDSVPQRHGHEELLIFQKNL